MRHFHLSSCLLALLILSPLALAANDTTDLRSLWHTGQTSRYRTISTRITTVRIRGAKKPRSTSMQVKTDVTWKVIQANPDGGGTCTLTVDRIAMALASPDGKTQLITADKAPEKFAPMSQFLKALTDSPITFTIAPDGRITDASGWQSIKSNAGEAGKHLSERDFIETAWELAPLPGGPAAAQDNARWTSGLDVDHKMGSIHFNSTYRFNGIDTLAGIPVAMINRTSTLSFTPNTSRMRLPPGASVDIKMEKGEMRSQIMFDLTRHEVAGENIDRVEIFVLTFTDKGHTIQQAIQQRYNTQILRITED